MKRKSFLDLQDKEFRHEYFAQYIDMGISSQMKAIREQRGYSQKKLGELAGMKQAAIARLENPEYEKLNTLKRIAAAFDVALLVRFVPFGEFIKWRFNPDTFKVPSFPEDKAIENFLKEEESTETDDRLKKEMAMLYSAHKEEEDKRMAFESQGKSKIEELYNPAPERSKNALYPTGAQL